MRALFFIHELGLNGAVIALLHQVRELRARGHAVSILTGPPGREAAPLERAFRDTGAEIVRLRGDPGYIDSVLADGAQKARAIARPNMDAVKDVLGLIR